MKKTLILTTALCGLAFSAAAQDATVNLLSWGGALRCAREAAGRAATSR